MKQCPYCGKNFKNTGINRHITTVHPDKPKLTEEQTKGRLLIAEPNPIVESSTDETAKPNPIVQEKHRDKVQRMRVARANKYHGGQPEAQAEEKDDVIVLPSTDADGGQASSFVVQPTVEHRSIPTSPPPSAISPLKKIFTLLHKKQQKCKTIVDEPKEKPIPKKMPEKEKEKATVETAKLQKRKPMEKDPENLISMMLSIPTWLLIISIPAIILLNIDTIIEFFETNDLGILLLFVITHPSDTASGIIIALLVILIIVFIAIFYKLVWRMAFKDFQIKYGEPRFMAHSDLDDDKNIVSGARRVYIPASKEGRVYASIGFGFWDRTYRKLFNVERPDKITLFVHRNWRPVNPFKPLSSCDKIYLVDPEAKKIYKDGKFRTIVVATRLVRDSEDNSIVYYLDDGAYPQESFTAEWYKSQHSGMLDNGLLKVSKGSLVNPDIQQDQMRRNMLWLPPQDVTAEKKLLDLIKKRTGGN